MQKLRKLFKKIIKERRQDLPGKTCYKYNGHNQYMSEPLFKRVKERLRRKVVFDIGGFTVGILGLFLAFR